MLIVALGVLFIIRRGMLSRYTCDFPSGIRLPDVHARQAVQWGTYDVRRESEVSLPRKTTRHLTRNFNDREFEVK